MRILLTTDTVGGVWTFTRELTEGLLCRGHAVCLVTFGGAANTSQVDWASRTTELYPDTLRVQLTRVPLEWMEQNEHAFDEGVNLLSMAVDNFEPDVLHSNQFCFGAFQANDMGPHPRLPRLITAHSDIFSWAEACRPQGLESSAWLTQYSALVSGGLRAADAVVAPTHWMADALHRHFPFVPKPEVVLNGRSLPASDTQAIPTLDARKLQAVTAGRLWDEGKNVALLTKLQSPMPIHVAGDQTFSGAESDLPQWPENVYLHDSLPEASLLTLFREGSIYLALSRYEPFGLAPLEAALCGCAVVANDLPSFHEVWGDAALYFRTARDLEELLAHLFKNPNQLEDARERSMTRAHELTADRMTDAYVLVYKRLLSALETSASTQERPAAHV